MHDQRLTRAERDRLLSLIQMTQPQIQQLLFHDLVDCIGQCVGCATLMHNIDMRRARKFVEQFMYDWCHRRGLPYEQYRVQLIEQAQSGVVLYGFSPQLVQLSRGTNNHHFVK